METGTRLGPYEVLDQLGAGGMGEVWLAQDTRLGRKVAIKVLPPLFASDPQRLARFEQEARAAAALNHPHIATVHDMGAEAIAGAGPRNCLLQTVRPRQESDAIARGFRANARQWDRL